MRDSFGVTIAATDDVVVLAYGYGARAADNGTRSPIRRFNRTRVVITDADRRERAVHPGTLGVVNRTTGYGYEGNAIARGER
jgi:hypothetical protein